jgi:hypothetical protein
MATRLGPSLNNRQNHCLQHPLLYHRDLQSHHNDTASVPSEQLLYGYGMGHPLAWSLLSGTASLPPTPYRKSTPAAQQPLSFPRRMLRISRMPTRYTYMCMGEECSLGIHCYLDVYQRWVEAAAKRGKKIVILAPLYRESSPNISDFQLETSDPDTI